MNNRLLFFFFTLVMTLPLAAQNEMPAKEEGMACPIVKVDVQQLPDLHFARSGHATLCLNGEVTVIGGHTSGFIPTATAEYFSKGKWHPTNTIYPHDNGLYVVLKSGKVLIAGGHEKHLGIGQTFPTELYNPATHSFEGFGCLDVKRSLACGAEIDSGKVVIAGNWYAEDGIELYDGRKQFTFIKNTSINRAAPYMFRISKDNVIMLGNVDIHGKNPEETTVDCLRGNSFQVPLFMTWKPLPFLSSIQSSNSFVGDESKGIWSYLLPVQNKDGQIAIARVDGTSSGMDSVPARFSLLSTTCDIPMQTKRGAILYFAPVIVDRNTQRAYLSGTDEECRWYILCVEYGKAKGSGKAPLTLYYTDPLPKNCLSIPVLTDDGDLMMAGGSRDDNFTPSANVFLMHLGNQASSTKTEKSHSLWIWMLVFCAVLAIIAFALLRKNRIRRNRLSMNNTDQEGKAPQQDNNIAEKSLNDSAYEQLMQRINELMETQKPYLNSELKVSDIADIFGIHRNEISACINSQKGCTFSQYINGYRIEHAKRQLRESPMKKVHAIWMESGFASEQTFFRIFKSNTGMTPKEWISSQND